jgi:sigma-B regulation protein RsbQ
LRPGRSRPPAGSEEANRSFLRTVLPWCSPHTSRECPPRPCATGSAVGSHRVGRLKDSNRLSIGELVSTSAAIRNNVTVSGVADGQPMVFLHGFGCDQSMWRRVAPAFEEDHRVVLLDHVGAGDSDISGYRRSRYSDLDAYARDVLEVCEELALCDVVLVGHSVSAMIGILAANLEPERFAALVLVGPSPRYIDDEDYVGGFSREDIDGLLETMDTDYLGWSSTMAPAIMGNGDRPELGEELTASFCRTDRNIARDFAEVTFLSDNRADLRQLDVRSVILQCSDDIIAPREVGEYMHRELSDSEFVMLEATGHCPHVSAPAQTAAAIRAFL